MKTNVHHRLEEANKRTLEIYKHVGYLTTHFAGLELTLLQLLAKMINPREPKRAERTISQLSLRQTIDAFRQTVAECFSDPEIISQANSLAERMNRTTRDRNDIIHSSWVAYSRGDYGQHRARSRGRKSLGNQIHPVDPVKLIDEVTEDVYGLIFDLACFEDNLKEKNSEQGAPADRQKLRFCRPLT